MALLPRDRREQHQVGEREVGERTPGADEALEVDERIALHGGVDERELFEGRHLRPRVPGRTHRLGVMARARLGANYVRLWSAATVSNLGDGVTLAALPLLAASLTRSPTSIAVVSFAGTLPWLLFALLSGASPTGSTAGARWCSSTASACS